MVFCIDLGFNVNEALSSNIRVKRKDSLTMHQGEIKVMPLLNACVDFQKKNFDRGSDWNMI